MTKKVLKTSMMIMAITSMFCTISIVKGDDVKKGIGKDETVVFVKTATEGDCHTSIVSEIVLGGPITVENTIQRVNSKGKYENKGRGYFYMSEAGQDKSINYKLGSTANTRTIWVNQTSNSFLEGTFYLDNGLV